MKLLVTGGAGYVGSVLVPRLLAAGHHVRVFDNLMYGGHTLLPFFSYPKFEFVIGDLCTEETPLNPLTIHGTTKTKAEQHLLQSGNAICYRFATAFGVSPRMRLDLLINDFVYQAVKVRNLIIYERTFKRTFIHVIDMARSFMFALENAGSMRDNVYNVGSDSMNYSKEQIAEIVRNKVDFYFHFADVGKDEDQRNYEVSYQKINRLGFKTTISVEAGIDELLRAYQVVDIKNPYANV